MWKIIGKKNKHIQIIHGITEWLGLEGNSGGHLVQTSLKQGHLEPVDQTSGKHLSIHPKHQRKSTEETQGERFPKFYVTWISVLTPEILL